MSTIFGKNIHSYIKSWDETERTKFQGFDVNSWAKDCFDSSFVMHYKTEDKTVDNRGVIHFTKDGCIILNGTIYSGAQCLNVVYEAYTGNKLNTAGEAGRFMKEHADDPHLAFVYFHIYSDKNIVGDQVSDSNSVGTGLFITSGRTTAGGLFYQHYFWGGAHYYRVIANNCSDASTWIEIQDISSLIYAPATRKLELKGIKNLSTSIKNPKSFIGNTASSVIIPLVDSTRTAGLLSRISYNNIIGNIETNQTNILKHNTRITAIEKQLPDLTDKVNKAVDRAIYNFDNIITSKPSTFKPISELYNYNGGNDSYITQKLQNIENCEINWYVTEKKFLLNLGQYQWPVTEAIIKNTNPDLDIWNQWYSMYGKPVIYGNTDNYQYNLYRETHGFNDQSQNRGNAANNIYVICSEGNNTYNNIESLSYILLYETGVKKQLDWLTDIVTSDVTKQQLSNKSYITTSKFNATLNNYTLKSKAGLNTDSINELWSSYNTLYNSFTDLQTSYNTLYNTVAYNISYHNSMIEYLIALHNQTSGATVTPAPVTSTPLPA